MRCHKKISSTGFTVPHMMKVQAALLSSSNETGLLARLFRSFDEHPRGAKAFRPPISAVVSRQVMITPASDGGEWMQANS